MNKLTEDEISIFNTIVTSKYNNITLMRTEYDGEEVAVIAVIEDNGDTEDIYPLYISVIPSMFEKLTPPNDDEDSYVKGLDADGILDQ